MKILLGNINAEVGRNDFFKPTTGNEILHEICNENGVTVLNFVTSKILTVKEQCSHILTFINLLGHIDNLPRILNYEEFILLIHF
jgi:hypothetical protein